MLADKGTLIEIKDLEAGFMIEGQFYAAVDHISLDIKPGKVTCVVGESGCGKSALAQSIIGLLPKGISKLTKGEIWFDGRNIAGLSEEELNNIRGKEIGMIFQEPMTALNPIFTIGFQVREALQNHFRINKKEALSRSVDLLKKVGISRAEKIINEYPHQLSGGMRQRVMIAMAIACGPKLLIADEPTTALDVSIQAQILELLSAIQNQSNMAIMLITHDMGVVAEMADEVVVMYAGQIVEQGDVNGIFNNPKHPYLKLLLQSIPRLDMDLERFVPIKGTVPTLENMPRSGCRFAERCPHVFERCHSVTPDLADIGENHLVRCLLYPESDPINGQEGRTR